MNITRTILFLAIVILMSTADNSTSRRRNRRAPKLIASNLVCVGSHLFTILKKSNSLRDKRPGEIFNFNEKESKQNSMKYKLQVTEKWPDIANNIQSSDIQFLCNRDFCRYFGRGQHGIGLCTRFSCHCTKDKAIEQTCLDENLIFDPLYGECDEAENIRLCNVE